jgi:hypothetical protein
MIRKVMYRRRWFQFSLATLLLLLAGTSVILAWMGRHVRNYEKEVAERRQAIQELIIIRGRATGWSYQTGASHFVFEGTRFDAPPLEQLQQTLTRNPNISHRRTPSGSPVYAKDKWILSRWLSPELSCWCCRNVLEQVRIVHSVREAEHIEA